MNMHIFYEYIWKSVYSAGLLNTDVRTDIHAFRQVVRVLIRRDVANDGVD